MADHVIDNSGSVEETRMQVIDLVRELTKGKLPLESDGGSSSPVSAIGSD
jgi:hypothetical protein